MDSCTKASVRFGAQPHVCRNSDIDSDQMYNLTQCDTGLKKKGVAPQTGGIALFKK